MSLHHLLQPVFVALHNLGLFFSGQPLDTENCGKLTGVSFGVKHQFNQLAINSIREECVETTRHRRRPRKHLFFEIIKGWNFYSLFRLAILNFDILCEIDLPAFLQVLRASVHSEDRLSPTCRDMSSQT